MKLIYVASPYRGDIEKNTEFARKACSHVAKQGHAFFAPHLLYTQLLDDSVLEQREQGMNMGMELLSRCDELWVNGHRVSKGMSEEIEVAKELEIPIRKVMVTEQGFDIERLPTDRLSDSDYQFTERSFEIRTKDYGNTGGGCMVAVVEFYLPEMNRSVFISATNENINISQTDNIFYSDGSIPCEFDEDEMPFLIFAYDNATPPKESRWWPMMEKALEYTIEQEAKYYRKLLQFPVSWLPDSIKDTVDVEYLDWLQSEEKNISIGKDGVVIDECYQCHQQSNSGMEFSHVNHG